MARQEKEDRLSYLRQRVGFDSFGWLILTPKKTLEEEAEVRSRPDIRSPYQTKSEREQNSYMKVKPRNFDQELQQKRQHDPNRLLDEMDECTFHPKLSQSGVSTPKSRGIRDLYEWNKVRQSKIDTEMFARLQNQPKYDFKPSISARSIKLAETKRSDAPLHERLILTAKEKEEKIERMRKE